MKSTTRGTLAAVVTGVAAAVAATATPAAAAVPAVPVPVPLDGVSKSLHTEVPQLGLEVPLITPGVPEGPRYVTGRLLPEQVLPQVPLNGALPGANLRTPLPHLVGQGFDHLSLDAPASALRAVSPGLAADAPLTPPDAGNAGLPALKLPDVGVVAPVLQTVPGADLGLGPGL